MNNTGKKPTTLTLNEKTKKDLAGLGKKGETFDTILQRVIGNSARLCGKNNNQSQKEPGETKESNLESQMENDN